MSTISIPTVETGESDGFEIPEIGAETDIERKITDLDSPWQDPDVLERLYWVEGGTTEGVAERLGCGETTVRRWLKRHGLGTRDRTDTDGWATRVERATYDPASKGGHERWTVRNPDGKTSVSVHQLLAIADGADPADVFAEDTHVHHRTCIPWLNMPDMVEVLTAGEHRRTHVADEWDTEDGIPVLVTQE